MNNILDLGFVVHIPSMCSAYHLGIRVLWKPSSAQEHAWGWKWCTLESFLRERLTNRLPGKGRKVPLSNCWWLEEIMHQLFYLNWCKGFWTINRMTWSFKFWRWSVSPFRSVYFDWNWRMIVSSPEETYLKEKNFLIEVFPFRVCAWDTVGLFSPNHWFFWGKEKRSWA